MYGTIPERLRGDGGVAALRASYRAYYFETMFLGTPPAFTCPQGSDAQPIHHLSFIDTCFMLTDAERAQLRHAWIDAVAHHPVAWLRHKAAVFRHVIGATPDPLWDPTYFAQMKGVTVAPGILADIYGGPVPELTPAQAGLSNIFSRLADTFIFRPWIYLVLNAVLVVWALWHRDEDDAVLGLIAASGLAHEAGLFLLAPSADYRYSHTMIYAAVLSTCLFVQARYGSRVVLRVDEELAPSG
jgi:hypothetical protein